MDEHGGHEDLCGSVRQSVIPYVHERTELYCSSLPIYPGTCFRPSALTDLFPPPPIRGTGPFIAQGRVVTMRPGARQVAPR
jgi:hypothetical protein